MAARSRVAPRDAALLAVVVVLAAILRLWDLGEPPRLVFDELFYAQDACGYLGLGVERCGVATEASWMHPPMGKWLIATGVALLGYDPVGWRAASAVAGTLSVALVFALARRLTGSLRAAVVAAGVLALDPMSVVASRVAMLDGFVAAALVATVLFAVMDGSGEPARTGTGDAGTGDAGTGDARGGRRRWRPWLAAAGIAAGVAVATKWSAAPVVLAVLALVLLRAAAAGRDDGRGSGRALLAAVPAAALWLVVVPAAVYLASYAGRLPADPIAPPWAAGAWPRELLYRQLEMLRFHAGLDGTHPYASPAWAWPLGRRAVVYFFEVDAAGRYREILAIPNVFLVVPGFLAAAAAGVVAAARRRLRAPEVVVAGAVAAAYLPWLVLGAGREFTFAYYLVPVVPFLALALGWASVTVPPGRLGPGLAALAIAVAAFVAWAPLVYARPLSYEEWRLRLPFTDCTPLELTDDGRLAPRPGGGEPPPGWCWV